MPRVWGFGWIAACEADRRPLNGGGLRCKTVALAGSRAEIAKKNAPAFVTGALDTAGVRDDQKRKLAETP